MPQDNLANVQLNNQTLTLMNNQNTTMSTLTSTQIYNRNATPTNIQALNNLTRDSNTDDTYRIVLFWLHIAGTVELVISVCFNVIALRIMTQCRKIRMAIRYLSSNFLVAVLVSSCNNLIFGAARFIIGLDGDIELLFDFRTIFYGIFVALTWCSLCALALERLLSIMFPLHYTRYLTKVTISIGIAVVWLVNILSPPLIIFLSWQHMCGNYGFITSCDRFAIFRPIRIFMASLSGIITCVTIVIYVKINLVIRNHKNGIARLSKMIETPL